MNLVIRLLWVIIQAFLRPRKEFWDESVVRFTVLPNDIDLNMHMTNSRYLSIMDLGRVDFMIRTGIGQILLKKKWQAVVGSANIRFRRSLKPFQKYSLHTRIIGMDEKWTYIEQRFESHGQLVAYAIIKGVYINSHGTIPVSRMLQEFGMPQKLPELDPTLQLWSTMDAEIKKHFEPENRKSPTKRHLPD